MHLFTEPSLHNVVQTKSLLLAKTDGNDTYAFQMGFPVDIGSFHFLNTSQRMQGAVQTGTEVFPNFLVEDIDVTCRHETWHSKSSRRGTGNSSSYKKDPQYSPIKVSYPSELFASFHTSTRMRCSHTHFGQIIG